MSSREPDAESSAQRDAESVSALEHGGLPVTATRRIEEALGKGGAWSSDLSVAELMAVRGVGFDPVGLVMGTSIYHIGFQPAGGVGGYGRSGGADSYPCTHGYYHEGSRTGYNIENTSIEQGITAARNLAMSRMVEEARELGAHGVVGLRVHFSRPSSQTGNVEFVAVGTAVSRAGGPQLAHPFTCHLSGQDFAKLLRIGYVPAAFVIGVGAVQVYPGCVMEYQERTAVNVELEQLTAGGQRARQIAVRHLEREVDLVGEGVVGVETSFTEHVMAGTELFEVQATGTAVRRFASEALPAEPLPMLRLRSQS